MNSPPGPQALQNPLLDGAEVRPDCGPDPRGSIRSHVAEFGKCRPGRQTRRPAFPQLTEKTVSITEASVRTTTNRKVREHIYPPLRLALARRSVKNQIFTYMDQGDRKEEIESRTGLSHLCIKWHRRLWRNEGSHPRPRSKKISKGSAQAPRSLCTQGNGLIEERLACDGKGDSSVVAESSREKRRRKHGAVRLSKGRAVCTRVELPGFGGGECAGREKRGLDRLADKENVYEPDAAMPMFWRDEGRAY